MATTNQGDAERLTDANFPIPKAISKNQLQDLLEAHGFSTAETAELSARIDGLVDEYSSHMKEVRRRRSAADDKRNLKDAIKKINGAIRHLKSCGPVARQITRHNASSLGEMLSVSWLRGKFPNEDALPPRAFAAGDRRHRSGVRRGRLREEPVYIEEHTSEARYYFAREQNLSMVSAVLSEINNSLDEALHKSKSPGGRPRCEIRHSFLIGLVLMWKQTLRDPHNLQPFLAFCEHVFEYIGWPLAGIKRAIDKALADPTASL
jgi:hypothetical protein